jgi:hypothetical protein
MSEARRAELIITGRVATLAGHSGFGWQPGLAIAGGRVLAAGPTLELEALADPKTERWHLSDDHAVIPGITDAHLHLMSLTLAESHIDLTGTHLDAALGLIRDADRRLRANGDEAGWLLGHGWALHDFGRWPDAAMLEGAVPGRPVALYAHDHHSRLVSATALRLAGIDASTADPAGGMIRRDDSGMPTGILHETASALVDHAIPDPSEAEIEAAFDRVSARLLALGITGCHDPGELGDDTRISRGPLLYRRLAEEGRPTLYVHASIRAPQLARAIELGLRSGQSVGRYRMGWLKLFADGSLGSRSAALLEPYTDADERPPTGGPAGMFLTDRVELTELVRRAADAGIASQIHAIGDAAVRAALDVFAALPSESGAPPLMRRIEHAQLIDPADVPRFGRQGVAASVQPVHLRSDAAAARIAWGPRAGSAFPLAGLIGSGALIPFGTDAPVESPDPWPGFAVAIFRRDPFDADAEPLAPSQGIDLPRALRAACLDPALVSGQTDMGRIVAGQIANMVVIPAAALVEESDASVLASTRPLATIVDGQVVYRSQAFGR